MPTGTPYPSEHAEQVAVATWLRRRKIWFFAVPNGAKMGAREASKMKKEGLEPGVLDLWVVDRGKILVIEMKARNGKGPSPDQKRWLKHLDQHPLVTATAVCYGAEDAIKMIEEYGFSAFNNHANI